MRRAYAGTVVALCAALLVLAAGSSAQTQERIFSQSKMEVEKALKKLQASSSGRLPVLEGFAESGGRSLDRFERGYYQCTAQVSTAPSGGTQVKVSAKITAWYRDPDASKAGYQVLTSNGRLESDFLDSLQDALGGSATSSTTGPAGIAATKPAGKAAPAPGISAPSPSDTVPILESKHAKLNSPFQVGTPGSAEESAALATRKAVTDKHVEDLQKQAQNLEEILKNQSHPTNLVAVKKSGTPVLASANEGAKVLFEANAEDEFEVLDSNANWVHVRISGLSRGWIRKASLELPSGEAEEVPVAEKAPAEKTAAGNQPPFQVTNEEISTFPGAWDPLRGKTVKIISVQKVTDRPGVSGPAAKLGFAKSLLNREYAELSKDSSTAAGVVVIFDTEDGGMMAATLPVLQAWKSGTLSEEAMWRRCYFDPPETFDPPGTK